MVSLEVHGDRLKVSGVLDEETETALKDSCVQLLGCTGDTVTLDLTQTDRINSASVGVLVALCMDLRASGKRAVLKPSKPLKRVLDMTGLTETFTLAAKPVEKAEEQARSKRAQF